jgi:hypothetical protein
LGLRIVLHCTLVPEHALWHVSKEGCEIGYRYSPIELGVNAADAYKEVPQVTRGGHLGIAPSWVKEGDEVCVLTGGSVPLVLRQTVL